MPQPTKQPPRKLQFRRARTREIENFLNAFRVLDRTVVEISMHIYSVPPQDRAAMLKQHRRFHDAVRKRMPRLFYPCHRK